MEASTVTDTMPSPIRRRCAADRVMWRDTPAVGAYR
jgi:hypothetical protein